MRNADRVSGGSAAARRNRHRPRRPGADIHRRNADAPGAIRQHCRNIGLPVNGQRDIATHRQPRAAAGNHQRLTVLDNVDHIIARHGIDPQTGEIRVYGDFARAVTGIAYAVRYRSRNAQLSVAQRL